jgi:hypothetical protein
MKKFIYLTLLFSISFKLYSQKDSTVLNGGILKGYYGVLGCNKHYTYLSVSKNRDFNGYNKIKVIDRNNKVINTIDYLYHPTFFIDKSTKNAGIFISEEKIYFLIAKYNKVENIWENYIDTYSLDLKNKISDSKKIVLDYNTNKILFNSYEYKFLSKQLRIHSSGIQYFIKNYRDENNFINIDIISYNSDFELIERKTIITKIKTEKNIFYKHEILENGALFIQFPTYKDQEHNNNLLTNYIFNPYENELINFDLEKPNYDFQFSKIVKLRDKYICIGSLINHNEEKENQLGLFKVEVDEGLSNDIRISIIQLDKGTLDNKSNGFEIHYLDYLADNSLVVIGKSYDKSKYYTNPYALSSSNIEYDDYLLSNPNDIFNLIKNTRDIMFIKIDNSNNEIITSTTYKSFNYISYNFYEDKHLLNVVKKDNSYDIYSKNYNCGKTDVKSVERLNVDLNGEFNKIPLQHPKEFINKSKSSCKLYLVDNEILFWYTRSKYCTLSYSN